MSTLIDNATEVDAIGIGEGDDIVYITGGVLLPWDVIPDAPINSIWRAKDGAVYRRINNSVGSAGWQFGDVSNNQAIVKVTDSAGSIFNIRGNGRITIANSTDYVRLDHE